MSSTPPRRFRVEPVETTTRSSKERSQAQDGSLKPPRKFAAEPFEFTKKSNRRFTPEPVETTVRSNHNRDGNDLANKPARRFKPQLVETTGRKNNDVRDKPRIGMSTPSTSTTKPPRRFAPQLIETAKRSRKAGDSTPAVLPSDKTEATPDNTSNGPRRVRTERTPPPPDNTPVVGGSQNPFFLEVQRQASPISMRRPSSRASTRSHHSFRVPDLDPIESSESEGSAPPSPSTSPSVASDHSFMYKEATRMRESVDDRFSGYLLDLAAKAAEKQLREQAMAAFPNDDHHEPFDHYIDRDSDETESQLGDSKRNREESFTEVNWEMVAMRQYHEKAEKKKQEEDDDRKKREAELNKSEPDTKSPWGDAGALYRAPRDPEMDGMRKGARPPMLGSDIKFPRCPSPEPARFDPTQGSHAIKSAMCYLTEQSQASEKGEGLWCGQGSKKNSSAGSPLSLWNSTPSRPPSRAGLWGGCCVNTGLTPPRGPTGILTPSIEIDNPMSPCPTPNHEQLPPTPPASQADFACIDEKLSAELAIEEEFGDDFVTQVYNYLSLGYPSIAQVFDEELARISQIALEDLRQDDHLAASRGYIRLGADGNLKNADITEESCMRWRALRVYIREWAKQQPGMAMGEPNANGGIGAAVRRGSWAI